MYLNKKQASFRLIRPLALACFVYELYHPRMISFHGATDFCPQFKFTLQSLIDLIVFVALLGRRVFEIE